MQALPFQNKYTVRKVAETAAKACDVCYRPSTTVLITEDNKDFFYICPVHLTDRNFCGPIIDAEAAKAKRERQMAEEKAKILKEFEEKQKKKKEKEEKANSKDADKDKDKSKDDDKDKKEDKSDEKKSDAAGSKEPEDSAAADEETEIRAYELKRSFFDQRVKRRRQAEAAKRDRERASQPGYFPDAPTHTPGQ